jgi:transposase-like protein
MQKKQYTPEFRQQLVKEVGEVGNSSIVARKYDLNKNIISRWVRESKNNGVKHAASKMPQDHKELLTENDQLKKLLGKKELEIEILRDLLKKANPQLKIK